MPKFLRNKSIRNTLIVLGVIFIITMAIYIILTGRHYFSRRSIREMQSIELSYGSFSPIVVFILILLSTVFPPLPIPVPLVEISAGVLLGFLKGFLVVWPSQIVSSLCAFTISKFLGKHTFNNFFKGRAFIVYRKYIDKNGSKAIFITRALMASPFNIVSYFAGLTQIRYLNFLLATVLGTIPESLLYPYLGSIIKTAHIRLWYVFILLVLLNVFAPVIVMMTIIRFSGKKSGK